MDRGQSEILLIPTVTVLQNVRKTVKFANTVDQKIFNDLVKLAIDYLQGNPIQRLDYEAIKTKFSSSKITCDQLFSNLIPLLRGSFKLRSKLKPDTYKNLLLNEFHMPCEYAENLTSQVFGPNQAQIQRQLIQTAPSLSKCAVLRWNIDVIISSNYLSKIMEPVIVFELITVKGKRIRFEASIKKFNKLRYAIAYVLKEMNKLEDKPILKQSA